MKLKNTIGQEVEVEGLDVNVWLDEEETERVFVTVYPMYRDANGYWATNTGVILNTIPTDLPPSEYDRDGEWYGFSDDTAPGDFPGEVLRFIAPLIE